MINAGFLFESSTQESPFNRYLNDRSHVDGRKRSPDLCGRKDLSVFTDVNVYYTRGTVFHNISTQRERRRNGVFLTSLKGV